MLRSDVTEETKGGFLRSRVKLGIDKQLSVEPRSLNLDHHAAHADFDLELGHGLHCLSVGTLSVFAAGASTPERLTRCSRCGLRWQRHSTIPIQPWHRQQKPTAKLTSQTGWTRLRPCMRSIKAVVSLLTLGESRRFGFYRRQLPLSTDRGRRRPHCASYLHCQGR